MQFVPVVLWLIATLAATFVLTYLILEWQGITCYDTGHEPCWVCRLGHGFRTAMFFAAWVPFYWVPARIQQMKWERRRRRRPWYIHKSTRAPGMVPYNGPTLLKAGIQRQWYATRAEARLHAAVLSQHNSVGFSVARWHKPKPDPEP